MTPSTVHRSIAAVLIGTFTLRFSTGLTGGLLVYYIAKMPRHGGPEISALELGAITAAYFIAELTLSPVFGVLADHLGAHRVMQWGPVFGAVAVIMTGVPVALIPIAIVVWLAVTRLLEGAAAGSSIPSILGYIALATSGDEQLRGRTVSRFEAATLAGLGGGVVAAGWIFDLIGPIGFFVNAAVYGLSFVIYRFAVADPQPARVTQMEAATQADRRSHSRFDWARYREVIGNPGVWLLAPTWIALNAVVGSWTTQSVFQLVRTPSRTFSGQMLMGGFDPAQVSVGLAVGMLVFFAGLLYWGNKFRALRRTTIIFIGIGGGLLMLAAIFGLNHSLDWGIPLQAIMALGTCAGLFVLAGATPAALGLLADMSEAHPEDRGAIMGLYSVFLAVGQITGALAGGAAADWRGIDGILAASLGLLLIALLPIHRLRSSEHLIDVHAHDGQRIRASRPRCPATASTEGRRAEPGTRTTAWRERLESAPHAPIAALLRQPARRPRRRGDGLASAAGARRLRPAARCRDLLAPAARLAGDAQRRADHPRGDGPHRLPGDGDAGRPSRRPVA